MQTTNNKSNVVIPLVIKTYLLELTDALLENNYFSYIEFANALVADVLDFANTIPFIPHHALTPLMQKRFGRYGKELHYVFFKRKTSKHTTWYIFFTRQNDRYIVRYVTNNHKDGKYIRNSFSDTEQ